MRNFYKIFSKAKVYLNISIAKTQMQEKLKLKSGYKIFKSF